MDQLPPAQQYPPQISYPNYQPVNPIAGPVQVFGIIYAILAGLSLIGAISLAGIIATAGARHQMGAGVLFMVIIVIVLISAVLNGATAYGLLAKKPWGRILLIVTSILSLLSIPIGTIMGGIALYFFMRQGADQDYARLTAGKA